MKQSGIRRERLTERIREELELMLEHEMEDPALEGVQLTRVSLSRDLATTRAFVALYRNGEEVESSAARDELMAALKRATGYLRRRLTELLDLRRTPDLIFSYDASARVVALIEEVAKDLPPEEEAPEAVAEAAPDKTTEESEMGEAPKEVVQPAGSLSGEDSDAAIVALVDESGDLPKVEFVVEDITLQDVDAVVNAANTDLVLGSGVAGAILRRGGAEIQEECNPLAPIPLGGVAITGAGRLTARHVIHAAAMGYRAGEGMATAETVRDAYRSCLKVAQENDLKSVALPALGAGVGGFPMKECGAVFADVVNAWRAANPAEKSTENGGAPELLRLCFLNEETRQEFTTGYGL